jgi:hypothetical protein
LRHGFKKTRLLIVGVFPNKTLVPAAYYGLAAKCPEILNP